MGTMIKSRVVRILGAAAIVAVASTGSALADDSEILRLSGTVVVAAEYAQGRGIVDVDGKQPKPLTLADV